MKLLLIGHGRHGKDTVAEMLRDYHGWTLRCSSNWCAEHVIWPLAQQMDWGFGNCPTWQQLYENRHDNTRKSCGRKFWFDAIKAYNQKNGADAVAKGVLSDADIYVGLRSRFEFEGAKHLFDHVIWVDRSEHLPEEDSSSMELTARDADIHLDNNGTLRDLWLEVDSVHQYIKEPYNG